MARILITGAAGFIGSHLAKACVMAGHEVHAVLRASSDDTRLSPLAGRIVPHRLDLREAPAVRRCLAEVRPRLIYHLAAEPRRPETADFSDVRAAAETDLGALVELLAAAASVDPPTTRLVRAGSLAEYGAAPVPYREDTREAPRGAYGAGLVAATHFCAALQSRLPFPVVTARLALTYGPAQSLDYLLPLLIRRCLDKEAAFVRHPLDRRDLVHVDDVVDALMRLGTSPLPGGAIVNVASGYAPTMLSVAERIRVQTGAAAGLIRYGPAHASSGTADLRGATTRARKWLGWHARIPLSLGIARTVDWYRDASPAPFASPPHPATAFFQASEVSP
jgi:nucleoside-diphosphate-sugar epimerase